MPRSRRRRCARGSTCTPRSRWRRVMTRPAAPDWGVAAIELESGVVVRLTTSFYVAQHSKQSGIEFHGDDGSLHLSSWQDFDAAVEVAPYRGEYLPVVVPSPFPGIDWGKAV